MFEVAYIYMKAQIDKLIDKFTNYSSCIAYQAESDTYLMETTGTNTYTGNKVNATLTEFDCIGSLSIDTENNRIVHTGATKKYTFDAVASVSNPSANNTTIRFALFKNGATLQDQTQSFAKIETQTGAATLNAASAVYMADGDYVEIFTKTDKTDASFTCDHMQLKLLECPVIVF